MSYKHMLLTIIITGCLLTTSCSIIKTDTNEDNTESIEQVAHTDNFEAIESEFYNKKYSDDKAEIEELGFEEIEDTEQNSELDSTESTDSIDSADSVDSDNTEYADTDDDIRQSKFMSLFTNENTMEYTAANYESYDDKLDIKKDVKYDSVANLINREYVRLKQDEIGEDICEIVHSPVEEAGVSSDELIYFVNIRGEYYFITYYINDTGAYIEHDDDGFIANDYLHLSDGIYNIDGCEDNTEIEDTEE